MTGIASTVGILWSFTRDKWSALRKSRPVITKLDTVTTLLLCQMEINGKVRAMATEWL